MLKLKAREIAAKSGAEGFAQAILDHMVDRGFEEGDKGGVDGE